MKMHTCIRLYNFLTFINGVIIIIMILMPSNNIIITRVSGRAIVRLLSFGVKRALARRTCAHVNHDK